jgi:protein phosphatase
MQEQIFRFDTWAVTHEGRVRDLNEDRYLVEPAAGMWVVADGMGGHDAGEIASGGIVEQLQTLGKPSSATDQHARFVDRLNRANALLQRYSQERNGATVGSTFVALLCFEDQYRCLWMGDSRIYRVRRGKLEQLTKDHSEVQELIDQGMLKPEEARNWPRRNVITRAVGVAPELDIDVAYGKIEHNDSYILCSDGLTAHETDADILEAVAGRKPKEACQILLDQTLERGGTDNVTVIIVQAQKSDSTVPVDMNTLMTAG